MRVWILALSFLFWTSCDTVRYGSVPCEGDDCEASSEIESSDSKDKPSDGNSSSENPSKDEKGNQDQKDSLDNKGKPDVRDTIEVVDTTTVTDAKSLPACNASNEGEALMVAGEQKLYYCISGSWETDVEELFTVECKDGVLKLGDSKVIGAESLDSIDASDYRRADVNIKGVAEKARSVTGLP